MTAVIGHEPSRDDEVTESEFILRTDNARREATSVSADRYLDDERSGVRMVTTGWTISSPLPTESQLR